MEGINERLPAWLRLGKYGFGVLLILCVSVIWVAASEWIQWIFRSEKYDKPYFMTFFNTTGFCFWNFGYLVSESWKRVPQEDTDETLNEATGLQDRESPYSRLKLFRCALLFCPLWFCANCLFNYSLSSTSVASNTILSTTSSIWALVFSRIALGTDVTWVKIASIVLCVGGTVLVALSDDEESSSSSSSSSSAAGDSITGDVLALVSAVFYGAYTTVLKACLPDDEKYSMGMVFGAVGVANVLLMWPGLILVDLLGIERFEFPSWIVFGSMAVNAAIGTNLSDVLWAKSVVLTSPLVATLGLSLTTPMAMVADFFLKHHRYSGQYVSGAVLITVGFVLINWKRT
jgi:solute carrier family 35 protein F5